MHTWLCIQWLTISIADKPGSASKEEVMYVKERRRWIIEGCYYIYRDHLAADTTGSQELWTCLLTSVGLSNCELTVPCAFNSWWAVIAHSNWIGCFGALPHSGCSSLRGRRLSLYSFSTWTTCYNNNTILLIGWWNLPCSSLHHLSCHPCYVLIKSVSIR